jgi:cell division protein FtsI (penicillin-binding protein 3)
MSYIKKPSSKSWQKTTIPYMAHGYEELVSPLHMLMLYNAVANNGKLMKPYLVSAIRSRSGSETKIDPVVLENKICSDQAIAQAKACLRAVVDSPGGTGRRILFDTAYSISGKTGTAVSANNNAGYNKRNKVHQCSFIGYFPSEAPKYTMVVVVQNTERSRMRYGADVAGRVFKNISDKVYNHYLNNPERKINISKDSIVQKFVGNKRELKSIFQKLNIPCYDSSASTETWSNVNFNGKYAVLKAEDSTTNTPHKVPDVRGMRLKDAVSMLESKGLVTLVSGKGTVLSQSVSAGSMIQKGQKILLMLN